jgi:RNA polymerase sigma factor (sigma-70 family)
MKFSDSEIVNGMLSSDPEIIQHFWFEQCTPMFHHIIYKVFARQAEKNELINELYLHLQANDWQKLRQFDYRSRLATWMSIVAIRFFQKKRNKLIENKSSEPLIIERAESNEEQIHHRLDVESLINRLPNERSRFVIRKLILEDKEPQDVANEMEITVDNLYNIKRRALLQLARIAGKEDSYVG